ncbi:purple acid phosphatase 3-like isoform X1 [Zingiber officinale]|uniref:purple acid phosphatase 3-like isoform X1 n=1 Tax=Zingiber officinale TaxID=94328 RepID=UPI001C4B7946|nr:purple acid phosphatase 3-like isoform X1 [Zingiber officinale]XP_042426359.1 purple acid phosphatase 3-like isoform X1 [Zingiber officinale]XP_042426364.1 purple acid phosphatase 3-like isoform X1 [Zingiber officinale]
MALAALQSAALAVIVLAAVTMAPAFVPCSAELQRFERSPKPDGSLSLLVIGDWGRNGLFNQSEVAFQMGRIGDELDIDLVISTGDNFYEHGLAGVDDKRFEESFSNVYTAKSLQKQWYSVLGNHDYRGNVLAQLSPVLRSIDGRWLCLRSFILNAEIVDFFFVDTTPFQESYWTNPGKHHYDWREVAPRGTYISNLLKDLDAALKESTAPWKIVVGHHTMKSVSEHGDTPELLTLLLPVLKSNGVDLYVNGHDHCLEHISSNDRHKILVSLLLLRQIYRLHLLIASSLPRQSNSVSDQWRWLQGMERCFPFKLRQASFLLRWARIHVPAAHQVSC